MSGLSFLEMLTQRQGSTTGPHQPPLENPMSCPSLSGSMNFCSPCGVPAEAQPLRRWPEQGGPAPLMSQCLTPLSCPRLPHFWVSKSLPFHKYSKGGGCQSQVLVLLPQLESPNCPTAGTTSLPGPGPCLPPCVEGGPTPGDVPSPPGGTESLAVPFSPTPT